MSSGAMTRVIVIPVRVGKSRLEHPLRAELARAMALDTIEAALKVAPVIVVTSDLGEDAAALGADVVADPGEGLAAAIEAGLARASTSSTRAVMLGDLPGLDPDELAEALDAAGTQPSFVADAEGTGTVLLTAPHALHFGPNSRQAHLDAGYRELLERWPTLRRDVDLVEHLAGLSLGPRTAALLG
jgi:2-phospho-L-lactate guanylyltransferase